jgi:hypothetical protein
MTARQFAVLLLLLLTTRHTAEKTSSRRQDTVPVEAAEMIFAW